MKTGDLFDITNTLLDRYAQAEGITTDYAIAKSLGCSQSTIHNYRKQKTKMDATTAVQLAERLGLDPLMVIAKVTTERNPNTRVRDVWGKYSGRLLLAAMVALTPIGDQISAQSKSNDTTIYTLYALICAAIGRLSRLNSTASRRIINTPRQIPPPATGCFNCLSISILSSTKKRRAGA